MYKKVLLISLFWFPVLSGVFCAAPGPFSFAEDTSAIQEAPAGKDPIVVTGDNVEYLHGDKKVVAQKNVVITYKDVKMTCNEVTVYLDSKEAIANGNVRITQKDAFFSGDRMTYNFITKQGTCINAFATVKPWTGRSKEIDKVSEKEIRLKQGYVSTCDLEHPHYRIQSKEVRIYLEDKIVARNIVVFIGDMPVLYLPYFMLKLNERKPQVSVMAGKDKSWGYYLLTGWRYFFAESFRGDIRLDYREKKGLAEGVDHYYSIPELGSGSAKFYFINENDVTAYERSGEVTRRWRGQVRHRWDMGYNTVNIVEFNTSSDKDFIKDYFYREYEEDSEPDNYISSVTTNPDYTLSVLARKRMDPFYTVVERLPEVKIDIKSHRIGTTNFYYKGELSGVYLNKTFENSIQKDIETIRFDTYDQLSYVMRLYRFLNVTPYAGVRETYYSRNRWGTTNVERNIFTAGVQNSTKFYKVFDTVGNFCGVEVNTLRHVITPSADYYYIHQPTVSPDNLYGFDEVDTIDTANGVILTLENKLQTKRSSEGQTTPVDLATFIVTTDYMFRLEKKAAGLKSQKFRDIGFLLELQPYPWLFVQSKMTVNTKNKSVETASVDFIATQGKAWSLGIGHRYESAENSHAKLFTLDLLYELNPKWTVRVYERVDALNGKIEEQEYTISRDLHCWIGELTYNVKGAVNDPTDHSIWLVFRLKAFPDMPLGFKKSYSRSQPGAISQGGAAW